MSALLKIVGMLMLSMFVLGAGQGPSTGDASTSDGDLTRINLVYTGDVGGKIEPCG